MISHWQTLVRGLPTRWRRKPAGIDMERNYVIVTLCIRLVQREQAGWTLRTPVWTYGRIVNWNTLQPINGQICVAPGESLCIFRYASFASPGSGLCVQTWRHPHNRKYITYHNSCRRVSLRRMTRGRVVEPSRLVYSSLVNCVYWNK